MEPAIGILRAAAWWAADYVYAAYWQVRATFDHRDAQSFRSGDGVPVVIIPGVYETWRFMQPLITTLHERGHPVYVIDKLRHNRRPVSDAAALVAAFLESEQLKDVVLVAHSKGGLAGKLVMSGPAGSRVRAMVAVATPFGGSSYARLFLIPSIRSFSPSDPGILELARNVAVNERIVSIYGQFDPHIPESSELVGAKKNLRLDTGGHFRVLADPRVIAEVVALTEA